MWLLIREASAARNLQALLPLLAEYGPRGSRSAPTTASRSTSPTTATSTRWCARRVAFGIPPEDALVCATLSPALWHGLRPRAVAPGYHATAGAFGARCVLHRRRSRAHRRGRPHQLDGPRRGRVRHHARGRAGDGVASRRRLSPPRPPRRDRARLPGRHARPARPRALRPRARAEARGAASPEIPRVSVPDWVRQTVRLGALGPEMFRIPWSGGDRRA